MSGAEDLCDRLDRTYRAAADPDRAPEMERYMRSQFAFLGIATSTRREIGRELTPAAAADPDLLTAVARWCFAQDEREYQYFACDALKRGAPRRIGPESLPLLEELIVTRSWWDTVDTLAASVAGPIVLRHPELRAQMDVWIESPNMWLQRSAIIHQLKHRASTDTDRLFRYAERRADEPDFFIRKAIGWALREYAKTDAEAVRRFVAANEDRLSPLSVSEATKHLR